MLATVYRGYRWGEEDAPRSAVSPELSAPSPCLPAREKKCGDRTFGALQKGEAAFCDNKRANPVLRGKEYQCHDESFPLRRPADTHLQRAALQACRKSPAVPVRGNRWTRYGTGLYPVAASCGDRMRSAGLPPRTQPAF